MERTLLLAWNVSETLCGGRFFVRALPRFFAGCTEPKANCTIKRRIGAVRLGLGAPYSLWHARSAEMG